MKTKKDFNPLIDSRLVHIDYELDLTGPTLLKKQQESKKQLISEIRKSFNIDGAYHEHILECSNGEQWYYSTSHARGTTMIMFAKWPVGLDCQYILDCPTNYSQYLNSNRFNDSEKEYFLKHNSSKQFLELWVAKESFVKVYYIEHEINPDFNKWKLIEKDGYITYTDGNETYNCHRGISEKYVFSICERQ